MVTDIISVFHLFLFQVEDHDAEAAGDVGEVAVEEDIVDALVAHDVLFLDVAHVMDGAIVADEVDIGVGIGHEQFALALIVADVADADVRQSVDFVQDIDGVVLCVIVE